MTRLFVYGTLLPGEVRWQFLEPFVAEPDGRLARVPGALYDTGRGYPAARFDEPGWIEGRVFALRPDLLDSAYRALDEVEGAVDGRYGRRRVMTESGDEAWAYEGGDGLPLREIPTGSWLAHQGRPSGDESATA